MPEYNKRSGLLGLILGNLDTAAKVATYLIPASFTGALVGWATWFTGIFQQHAPASWIYATVIGGFIGLAGMALFAYARERLQRVRFRNATMNSSSINALETIFTLKRIRVVDLCPPIGAIIEGKTFVDCDIVGPANIAFEACQFHGNSGAVVDAIIIKPGLIPNNGYGFRNCIFRQCRFYGVTFMVAEPDYAVFGPPHHHGLNWITETPDAPPLKLPPSPQRRANEKDKK